MLVALMGGGQGMEQELRKEFEGFATNSGFIFAQKTGEAYKGFRKGRSWDLEMADVERIGKLAPNGAKRPSTRATNTIVASKGSTPTTNR